MTSASIWTPGDANFASIIAYLIATQDSSRNRVINGGMNVDQRNEGAAQTFVAGAALAYSVDRFYGYCTGANVTGQRVASTLPARYEYKFTGAAGVTGIGFGSRLEAADTFQLAGTKATLSVKLANTLLTTVSYAVYYAATTDSFGTLAAPTRTLISSGNFTVDATLTKKSVTLDIPAAAVTGLEIVFSVGAQISGTFSITELQIEAGEIATGFEYLQYHNIKQACLRYYEKSFIGAPAQNAGTSTGEFQFAANQSGANAQRGWVTYKVKKRIVPTAITLYNPAAANAQVRDVSAAADCSATTSNAFGGVDGFSIATTGAAGTVLANSLRVHWTADAEL